MRKTILFVAAVMISAAAYAFPFFGKKSITGYIQIYGSEPHTFVGFVTDKGKNYTLDVAHDAPFTIRDITEKQGKMLTLKGVVNSKELPGFKTLKDGRFVVSKFTVVE